MRLILGLLLIALFSSCKDVVMDRVCEPQVQREFNVVYNAHFKGQLILNNTCNDTAYVLRLELPTDTVPPGKFATYHLSSGEQYYVAASCNDSTLTYTYQNLCP